MAIDFQEDSGNKLDFQLDFQEDKQPSSGDSTPSAYGSFVRPAKDLYDEAVHGTTNAMERAMDPETYKKGAEYAKQGLADVWRALQRVHGNTFLPPSPEEETMGYLGSGAVGFGAGLMFGPATPRPGESAEQRISDIANSLTYQPKTERGKEGMEQVNSLINSGGIAMAGHGHIMPEASPKLVEAMQRDREAIEKFQTEGEAAKPEITPDTSPIDFSEIPPNPVQMFRTPENTPYLHTNEANMDLLGGAREREAARKAQLDQDLEQSRQAVSESLARINDQRIMEDLQKNDDIASGLEDREARLQNDSLAGKLQDAEASRGENPIYVDPQGQAFRGDPNDPNARLGLDKQTDAMDRELTPLAGKDTPAGEPLRPLRDVERQDAMQTARDTRINELDGLAPEPPPAKWSKINERDGFGPVKIKGNKQRGSQTILNDLSQKVIDAFKGIDDAVSRIDIPNKLARDAIPTMKELYQKTGNPDVISFARKELKALGYPFDVLSAMDKAIVAAHQMKLGEAQARVIPFRPRGQKGGVTLDLLTLGMLPKESPVRKMAESRDGTFIPEDPTPEQLKSLIEKARTEEDGNSAKYFDSGAALTALKRGSTAIDTMHTLVFNSLKRADLAIRKVVFPAERAVRALSTADMQRLGDLLKQEMFKGDRAARSTVAMMNAKMQNAYRNMREMFDKSLDIQNEGRAARGQTPITPQEAYLSSRWQGDFRRPLYDAKGKLVWYLAGDSKMDLNAQTRAVLKDHPDLVYDPKKDHVVRLWNRKTDLESAYTAMLDIVGRDDPAVKAMKDYMEDQTVGRGATFLNQEKHFKAKGNVRGFVGDRPELKVNDYSDRNVPGIGELTVGNSPKSEALALFQQQVTYAKNGIRWSEMQKSAQSIKQLLNDPTLVEHQPNNVKYMREYWKHSIGYGESRAIRVAEDSLRDFGISPTPFAKAVGGLKSYFILDKVAASAGYVLAQGVQFSMVLPHIADLAVKHGFVPNLPKATIAGLLGGLTMGSGHIFNAASKTMRFEGIPQADFFNRAFKYAEDNGITARSIYDESPIQSSFSKMAAVGKGLSKTISVPEIYLRSATFMTLAQVLKDSGKFKDEMDVFKEAEKRTNMAIVDYASSEKPMIFTKMGTPGNFLNTLQTYGFNWYNQLSYFAREANKGNVGPLLAFLAVGYATAGADGIPYFEDIYKSYMGARDMMPASVWQKIQKNEFLREPKLWLMKNGGPGDLYNYLRDKSGLGMVDVPPSLSGQSTVYGAVSTASNKYLTSRISAPTGGQMLQSPLGPIQNIGQQAMDVGKAIIDPTNTTKLAQAAYTMTPTGLQGAQETAPYMEGHAYNTLPDGTQKALRPTKMEARAALADRGPEDIATRRLGLRTMNEQIQRDVNYANKRDMDAAANYGRELPDKFYDAVRRGDKEEASEFFKTYVFMTGKGISQEQFNSQIEKEYMTDYERSVKNAKSNLQALSNLKRSREIFDQIQKENGNGNQ